MVTAGQLMNFLKDCNPEARVRIEIGDTWEYLDSAQEDRMGVSLVAVDVDEEEED